jgi:hypothetical protein
MAKKRSDDFPADMWLMVATDALARYAAGGGGVVISGDGGNLVITLEDVGLDDPRLSEEFATTFSAMVAMYEVVANGHANGNGV